MLSFISESLLGNTPVTMAILQKCHGAFWSYTSTTKFFWKLYLILMLVVSHINILHHYVKSFQIQSLFWSVFSRIWDLSVFSSNVGKYGSEKSPHLDTFHALHIYIFMSSPMPNMITDAVYLISSAWENV